MTDISPELAQTPILDAEGNAHTLETLWAESPAVIIFVRHFA